MSDLPSLFLNGNGLFSKLLQFEVVIVFVSIVLLFTTLFRGTYAFAVILISFAWFVATAYSNIRQNTMSDANQETYAKLLKLQSIVNEYVRKKVRAANNTQLLSQQDDEKIYRRNVLDSLYIDANMINFLHSIIVMQTYSESEFYMLLKGVNNILRIRNEIEQYHKANGSFPSNVSQMLELALQLRANTINNMHNFVYTIPKTKSMYDYANGAIERFMVLISRNTDYIYTATTLFNRKTPINNSTLFVSYNTTKPFDRLVNTSVVPTKTPQHLVPYYI
jgi:hypothetical protein